MCPNKCVHVGIYKQYANSYLKNVSKSTWTFFLKICSPVVVWNVSFLCNPYIQNVRTEFPKKYIALHMEIETATLADVHNPWKLIELGHSDKLRSFILIMHEHMADKESNFWKV